MTKKLYTVLIHFADHLIGIGQYEAESAEQALEDFILTSEALEGYDRERLNRSVNPLFQPKAERGLWSVSFSETNIGGADDNPVLGGHIVQTDLDAPTRNND
jgi:hypothetical protein